MAEHPALRQEEANVHLKRCTGKALTALAASACAESQVTKISHSERSAAAMCKQSQVPALNLLESFVLSSSANSKKSKALRVSSTSILAVSLARYASHATREYFPVRRRSV